MQNILRVTRFIGETQVRYMSNKDTTGPWMRKEMASMGPAFIKMGQFLSTRSDLLDKSVSRELARLQDDLEPVPFIEVAPYFANLEGIIDVDPVPIACASIGQVHKARFRGRGNADGDGTTELAIKVQKPNAASQIKADLDTLGYMVKLLEVIGSPRANELSQLLSEFRRFLMAELDYTAECQNMIDFYKMFEDKKDTVCIPRVYPKYSNESILVMEFVGSTKITNTDGGTGSTDGGSDGPRAKALVSLFVDMIVRHGFVHCDPHPGNVGIGADNRIVLYDFGNVVRLSQEFRAELNNLLFAIYQKDVDEFTDLLLRLKILEFDKESSPQDLPRIRAFFRSFFEYLETVDFELLRKSIREDGSSGINASSGPQGLRINSDFLALFRVFSLLDGTCSKLDPNFNYIDVLTPYAQEALMNVSFWDSRARRDFDKLRGFPKVMDKTNDAIARVDNRIDDMDQRNNTSAIYACAVLAASSFADIDVSTLGLIGIAFIAWRSLKRF